MRRFALSIHSPALELTPSDRSGTLPSRTHVRPKEPIVELSPRQREILEFVNSHVDRHGYPPTVREIGGAVGLTSPSTVHAHLARLEAAGLIRRDPTKPRALEVIEGGRSRERPVAPVVEAPPRTMVLTLIGAVAAGTRLVADEQVED